MQNVIFKTSYLLKERDSKITFKEELIHRPAILDAILSSCTSMFLLNEPAFAAVSTNEVFAVAISKLTVRLEEIFYKSDIMKPSETALKVVKLLSPSNVLVGTCSGE